MAAIGGSIQELNIAGRTFGVAADAESQRKLGGSKNEFQANGDGATGRIIKTAEGWSITGLMVEIDDSRGDAEFLQELSDAKDFFPVGVTYASGVTYQGRGTIVDDLQTGSQNATASISLAGPGKLTPQS
jgi:hypothetical protein